MNLIDKPEGARRLARAIASDVSLYNEEKVIKGIENDDLFEVMKHEIEEGRQLFKSRVTPELYDSTNIYERAIVDLLLKPKAHIKSTIW